MCIFSSSVVLSSAKITSSVFVCQTMIMRVEMEME